MFKKYALVRPLTSLGSNPIQHKQARNNVGEDTIEGITDRVGVTIDSEKDLDTKGHNKHNQHNALPGYGIIHPAPLAKPGSFHDNPSLLSEANTFLPLSYAC